MGILWVVIGFLREPGATRKAPSHLPESVAAPLTNFRRGYDTVKLMRPRGPEKMGDSEARGVKRREVGMFLRFLPVAADPQLQRAEHGAG
jgi:hypothetical protein